MQELNTHSDQMLENLVSQPQNLSLSWSQCLQHLSKGLRILSDLMHLINKSCLQQFLMSHQPQLITVLSYMYLTQQDPLREVSMLQTYWLHLLVRSNRLHTFCVRLHSHLQEKLMASKENLRMFWHLRSFRFLLCLLMAQVRALLLHQWLSLQWCLPKVYAPLMEMQILFVLWQHCFDPHWSIHYHRYVFVRVRSILSLYLMYQWLYHLLSDVPKCEQRHRFLSPLWWNHIKMKPVNLSLSITLQRSCHWSMIQSFWSDRDRSCVLFHSVKLLSTWCNFQKINCMFALYVPMRFFSMSYFIHSWVSISPSHYPWRFPKSSETLLL